MTDTTWGFKSTAVCTGCHGEVADFNDVQAFYDYDRNGKIEGVQTEIQGLLDQVKAKLPKDGTGEVIGSGTVGTGCFLELNGSKITKDQRLKPGDVVALEIDRLGRLENKIVAG